jgi:hypothetical protein
MRREDHICNVSVLLQYTFPILLVFINVSKLLAFAETNEDASEGHSSD